MPIGIHSTPDSCPKNHLSVALPVRRHLRVHWPVQSSCVSTSHLSFSPIQVACWYKPTKESASLNRLERKSPLVPSGDWALFVEATMIGEIKIT